MKIAGRKNDGAWFRANKVIKALSVDEKAALAEAINDLPSMGSFLEAVQAMGEAAGLNTDHPSYPTTSEVLAAHYTQQGIPRQAWMGNWSYDTYTRTGTAPDYEYEKDHWEAAHNFGKEIRKLMKNFTFARRQLKDLSNIELRVDGNPGGIADATEPDDV